MQRVGFQLELKFDWAIFKYVAMDKCAHKPWAEWLVSAFDRCTVALFLRPLIAPMESTGLYHMQAAWPAPRCSLRDWISASTSDRRPARRSVPNRSWNVTDSGSREKQPIAYLFIEIVTEDVAIHPRWGGVRVEVRFGPLNRRSGRWCRRFLDSVGCDSIGAFVAIRWTLAVRLAVTRVQIVIWQLMGTWYVIAFFHILFSR